MVKIWYYDVIIPVGSKNKRVKKFNIITVR